MTNDTDIDQTWPFGGTRVRIAQIGGCGFLPCKHRVCVSYYRPGESTTRNDEAYRVVLQGVKDRAAMPTLMASSAQLCITDAEAAAADGDHVAALSRLLRSLEFSVGVRHPQAKQVAAMLVATGDEAARGIARMYGL